MPIAVVIAACVPAEDTVQPVYGSVAFALSASSTKIDLSDGWSFTLEHFFAVPSVSLGPGLIYGQSSTRLCSSRPDSRSGQTLVDYVPGTTFDINQLVPNGACTDLNVDPVSSYTDSLGVDPGVSDADRAAYVGTSTTWLPTRLVVGTATRAGETKRLWLRFSGSSGPVGVSYVPYTCSPIRDQTPVTLGVANVRQTFHFTFDLASIFPGSPPKFGPIADADLNHDGVVTIDELGECLQAAIDFQIETGWHLSAEDGRCQVREAGLLTPRACDAGADGVMR